MPLREYINERAEPIKPSGPDNIIKFPRRKLIPGINDLATKFPTVAEMWDSSKNGGLMPTDVLPGSNKKVWWRCEKGHSWQAAPYTLTGSNGRCPCCAGKQVVPGETDLATRYPEVADLWDYENNGKVTPAQIMPATKKKFWWRCEQGHSWEAAAYSLTILGTGCPYCSGHKVIYGETDLATKYPEAALLWDEERNETSPTEVAPGSHAQAWWKCSQGHNWQARVFSVAIAGNRCPVCAGLKRKSKQIAKEIMK